MRIAAEGSGRNRRGDLLPINEQAHGAECTVIDGHQVLPTVVGRDRADHRRGYGGAVANVKSIEAGAHVQGILLATAAGALGHNARATWLRRRTANPGSDGEGKLVGEVKERGV